MRPSVVPSSTCQSGWYCAASTTVAICVLSPISARKNATSDAANAPRTPPRSTASSSMRSGLSAQSPTAAKLSATSQTSVACGRRAAASAPSQDASAWFASVAIAMPAAIANGCR